MKKQRVKGRQARRISAKKRRFTPDETKTADEKPEKEESAPKKKPGRKKKTKDKD